MRDRETIDSELRLLAAMRRSIRDQGGQPSCQEADALLDERLGHRTEASDPEAVGARGPAVVAGIRSRRATDAAVPYPRKGVLRRFGPFAALPLSLVAVAVAVLVVISAVHKSNPAAEPAQPAAIPPSSAQPSPAAPKVHAPSPDIVDNAFVDALKQQGVPVPSHEYVTTQGHGVCDFLAHQPNFAEAIRFVQRSSIWDANQSAQVATGAVISYCPQYYPSSPDEMQQALQNALSGVQGIEGNLHGIQDDLHGIQDDLHGIQDGLQPVIPGGQ